MKKGPTSSPGRREREKKVPKPKERAVTTARQRLIEVVEDPDVTQMRSHLLEQFGAGSIEEAMRDEDHVSALCSGGLPPESVGSALFAEMLFAAARSSRAHAQLLLESLDDLRTLAEGDEDDLAAVEKTAAIARETCRRQR